MPGFRPNATAGSLLGFLHERPMTGWDLVQTAQDRIGNYWSLTRSQVYRELTAMARAGLIEAGERGPRDRLPFTITDAGREAFQTWLMQEPPREHIRFPLLVTVLFGKHLPPERLHAFLASHKRLHAERLAKDETLKATVPKEWQEANPYVMATVDFGIAYERAALEWFDNLPAALRGKEVSTEPFAPDTISANTHDGAPDGGPAPTLTESAAPSNEDVP